MGFTLQQKLMIECRMKGNKNKNLLMKNYKFVLDRRNLLLVRCSRVKGNHHEHYINKKSIKQILRLHLQSVKVPLSRTRG